MTQFICTLQGRLQIYKGLSDPCPIDFSFLARTKTKIPNLHAHALTRSARYSSNSINTNTLPTMTVSPVSGGHAMLAYRGRRKLAGHDGLA